MKEKIKKIIYYYTENSRISTKELGKLSGVSQQSASYILNQLKKRKLILDNVTIVDGVKLGFVNVFVGFNFLRPDLETKKIIIDELKEFEAIISIEEGKEGLDLLLEFSCLNLAAFNKIYFEIIQRFDKGLKTVFIFPLITRKEYSKKYLIRKKDFSSLILFGDRIVRKLHKKELEVLYELVLCPEKKLINLSESINIPVKSFINVKKKLEKEKFIRGYSTILDYNKTGIYRKIIFLRFLSEGASEIEKFEDYARANDNIVELFRVIGASQVGIVYEGLSDMDIIKEIRTNFPIDSYFLIKCEKIHKKRYIPGRLEE